MSAPLRMVRMTYRLSALHPIVFLSRGRHGGDRSESDSAPVGGWQQKPGPPRGVHQPNREHRTDRGYAVSKAPDVVPAALALAGREGGCAPLGGRLGQW